MDAKLTVTAVEKAEVDTSTPTEMDESKRTTKDISTLDKFSIVPLLAFGKDILLGYAGEGS